MRKKQKQPKWRLKPGERLVQVRLSAAASQALEQLRGELGVTKTDVVNAVLEERVRPKG